MHNLNSEFSDFNLQESYPSIGTQATVNRGTFTIVDFGTMNGRAPSKNLSYDLMEYLMAMSDGPSDFLSYLAIFPESQFDGEVTFEKALWDLLDRLHIEDGKHFGWNLPIVKIPTTAIFPSISGSVVSLLLDYILKVSNRPYA